MALDATVAGANANSYVSLGFADDYFADTMQDADWTRLGRALKEPALVSATLAIDNLITLRGLAGIQFADRNASTPQKRLFPRTNDLTPAGATEIPDDIEAATCLLALHLALEAEQTFPVDVARARELGVRMTSADGLTIIFGTNTSSYNMWPREVKRLVAPFWNRGGKVTVGPAGPVFRDRGSDRIIAQ